MISLRERPFGVFYTARVKDGRRKGPADTSSSRPVNPQVRTRPGAPANIRLCARSRLMQRSKFRLEANSQV